MYTGTVFISWFILSKIYVRLIHVQIFLTLEWQRTTRR